MISTRGRYGLRIVIDIAEDRNSGYIPMKEIAARQEICKKYLEVIVGEMTEGSRVQNAAALVGI